MLRWIWVITDEQPKKNKKTKEILFSNENNYLSKSFILNGISGDLYDYYRICMSTKEDWLAMNKKFNTKEVGAKIYVLSHYNKYWMIYDI